LKNNTTLTIFKTINNTNNKSSIIRLIDKTNQRHRQETMAPPNSSKEENMNNLPSKCWFEDLTVLRDPLPPLPLDLDLDPEEGKTDV